MRKLLSAGLLRLRKNRLFFVGICFMFGIGLLFSLGKYSDMARFGAKQYLDDVLYYSGILHDSGIFIILLPVRNTAFTASPYAASYDLHLSIYQLIYHYSICFLLSYDFHADCKKSHFCRCMPPNFYGPAVGWHFHILKA